MTNEEALVKVKGYLTDYLSLEDADEIDEIIEALKQQPCEDCVSRETAIDQFKHWYSELLLSQKEEVSFEDILKSLPSVLPQPYKAEGSESE